MVIAHFKKRKTLKDGVKVIRYDTSPHGQRRIGYSCYLGNRTGNFKLIHVSTSMGLLLAKLGSVQGRIQDSIREGKPL